MKKENGSIGQQERLYPTEKEERKFQELKEKYGLKDSVVVKAQLGKQAARQFRSCKGAPRRAS